MEKYLNRKEAGKILADHLKSYAHHENTLVLGLPRGGVPVAYEIANYLSLPLDILIVRKLGVPHHEELAMGAIASGGVIFLNQTIIRELSVSKKMIDDVIKAETQELARREIAYRGSRPLPELKGKTVILVDDGIATGATIRAGIQLLRKQEVSRIVAAVPVAAEDTCRDLTSFVDELVCPLRPVNFMAVGEWYEDFGQTTDQEVRDLMSLHAN